MDTGNPVPQVNLKFRSGKHCLVPHLEFPIVEIDDGTVSEWLLQGVLVGPSAHQELAKRAIENLLEFHHIPAGSDAVSCSAIPLRET
jgi:hypothetical protein